MQSISAIKRRILLVCLFALVICGCAAPSENKLPDQSSVKPSGSVIQVRRMCMELPAFLDEEEFSDSDDTLVGERVHSRKAGLNGNFIRLFLSSLLTGLLALLLYLLAGVSHGSSCPTYGLSRIITYIFHSDGRKSSALFS